MPPFIPTAKVYLTIEDAIAPVPSGVLVSAQFQACVWELDPYGDEFTSVPSRTVDLTDFFARRLVDRSYWQLHRYASDERIAKAAYDFTKCGLGEFEDAYDALQGILDHPALGMPFARFLMGVDPMPTIFSR